MLDTTKKRGGSISETSAGGRPFFPVEPPFDCEFVLLQIPLLITFMHEAEYFVVSRFL